MDAGEYESLVASVRPRLARAFITAYGFERGQEALAEAMAWGWEHRDRLSSMENPAGYLYRVGQSRSRPRHGRALFPAPTEVGVPWIEPKLSSALEALSEHQRLAVMLVHAYQWTHREVADLVGLAPTTIQSHLDRGLAKLRLALEVSDVT